MIARLALLTAVVALTACTDDDDAPSAESATTAANTEYVLASGPDDAVISVSFVGGFVPVETVFTNTPVALISGDGLALSTGPVTAIYPGPLLPNVLQRPITPEATQELVGLADELGLLEEIVYAGNDLIADAADTVVTITVDGTIYRHQAYALGLEEETDEDRAALAEFVAAMTDLPATVGDDQLGPEEPYAGDEYMIRATPIDPEAGDTEVAPTVVDWPADASVRLADAWDCVEVPVAEFAPLFAEATQLTYFRDADLTYQVLVKPRLPDSGC